LHYLGIRGSTLAIDAVVDGLFGVEVPRLPMSLYLCRAKKTKVEKCSERVRSRPDIRFIPLRSWNLVLSAATTWLFFKELAKQAAASKGMHVG
jgi:hypothetical protein